MAAFFKKISREDIAVFSLMVIFASMVLSRFMMTAGMILLIANALFSSTLKKDFKDFLNNKVLLAITSLFLVCLASGLYSTDLPYFTERMRIKLPFLLLPFAFSALLPFSRKKWFLILYFFLGVITLAAAFTIIRYAMNYESLTQSYLYASVLPTPISHIRFSLMNAFAVIVGIYLLTQKIYLRYPAERLAILSAAIFLFGFQHVLAVRSGLIALYGALLCMAAWYIIQQKKYSIGIITLAVILALPFIAYKTVPTFKNKINYTLYDWGMYERGANPSDFSDGGRFYSYKVGWQIAKENFLLGVGYGDLVKEANTVYENQYPEIKQDRRLLPHNQFLFFFAAMGFTGMFWLTGVFLFPLLYHHHYRNVLLLCFHCIILLSFMTEATIEDQHGTAFYILFLLLLLNPLDSTKPMHT